MVVDGWASPPTVITGRGAPGLGELAAASSAAAVLVGKAAVPLLELVTIAACSVFPAVAGTVAHSAAVAEVSTSGLEVRTTVAFSHTGALWDPSESSSDAPHSRAMNVLMPSSDMVQGRPAEGWMPINARPSPRHHDTK